MKLLKTLRTVKVDTEITKNNNFTCCQGLRKYDHEGRKLIEKTDIAFRWTI